MVFSRKELFIAVLSASFIVAGAQLGAMNSNAKQSSNNNNANKGYFNSAWNYASETYNSTYNKASEYYNYYKPTQTQSDTSDNNKNTNTENTSEKSGSEKDSQDKERNDFEKAYILGHGCSKSSESYYDANEAYFCCLENPENNYLKKDSAKFAFVKGYQDGLQKKSNTESKDSSASNDNANTNQNKKDQQSNNESHKWLADAQKELQRAQRSYEAEDFHQARIDIHYCCEKSFKAYLIFKTGKNLDIHELLGLIFECAKHNKEFNKFKINKFPKYNNLGRYPDERYKLANAKDIQSMFEEAKNICSFIKQELSFEAI